MKVSLFKYTEVAFYFINSMLSVSSVFYFFFSQGLYIHMLYILT